MSLWSIISEWSRRRHQRRVLRRLAKLDAQIAATAAELEETRRLYNQCTTISNFAIHGMAALAAKEAHLKRIRAHNVQHEDVL
jgi:hypothetical protein